MDGNRFTVKDIAIIAMLASILFIQEEALTFIPNVQLTAFLLVLYSKKLGLIRTAIILAIHVILDNLFMGSFNYIYTPAMFIGWIIIPLAVSLFLKKVESQVALAIVGAICSILYCWCFALANSIVYHVPLFLYLTSDILFELILALSSFVSTLFLYKPCAKIFDKFI